MAHIVYNPVLKVEDLKVGQSIETEGRTIFESDVLAFCGLVGDTNPVHLNESLARSGPWGHLLVPATLTASMAIGLFGTSKWLHAILMPFIGMAEWRVERPVFPRDTIRATVTVRGIRQTSDGRRHILELLIEVFAERGAGNTLPDAPALERVMTFNPKFMIQNREVTVM